MIRYTMFELLPKYCASQQKTVEPRSSPVIYVEIRRAGAGVARRRGSASPHATARATAARRGDPSLLHPSFNVAPYYNLVLCRAYIEM
ncbi:hypothetical protein EVAR_80968_1 [Eumeta japonica]|uniref:Uncharacterized protein n=1 Tax=Eumeta variegata TaxID=151549 RepID=A0A4C1WSB8_EUMVA|nr:hypothetical protein EVAR_80968_1 [Eumeta japonica]